MSSRIRRGQTFWEQAIFEQSRSGESQAEFCRARSLKLSTFAHWRGRLRAEEVEDGALDFVQVFPASPDPTVASHAEIHIPSGPVLRCIVGTDPHRSRDLTPSCSAEPTPCDFSG